ncbi:MAG: cytochrome b N-terminal domain-containing protein [Solirubrobacterales bacterium]|jgi:cytochrome b561
MSLLKRKKTEAAGTNGSGDAEAVAKPTRGERMGQAKDLGVHHGTQAGIDVAGWVDSRVNATGIFTAMMSRHVPKGTNWFYTLGSATMFIFAMQAITGVFLSMYYTPSATQAYASITHMTNEVFMGEFVRGMHKWGASLMIILIFLHMARTFFFGAYKYPRELNWVIGVVLLILTTVMGLTGYLLPFDQRSFWATIVANNITASGPVVGPYLADFLRAGPDFSATTLSRFYALHMMVVPGLIAGLIGAHLFFVVKLGTTAPPWVRAGRPKGARPEEAVTAGVAREDFDEVPVNGAVAAAVAEAEPPVAEADAAEADAVEAREAEETEAAVATDDPAEEAAAEEAAQAPAEEAPVEETPVEEVSTEVPSEEPAADETAPEEPPADPADAPDEPEASGEGEVNS